VPRIEVTSEWGGGGFLQCVWQRRNIQEQDLHVLRNPSALILMNRKEICGFEEKCLTCTDTKEDEPY
jgi:hypothetical protein